MTEVAASLLETSQSNGFIFFGCWNEGGCNTEGEPLNNLTKTMRTLKRYTNEHTDEIDFLVVAGDNYYPSKQKNGKNKVKYGISQNLQSGFDCLSSIEKPTHILLGNHEIEKVPFAPPTEVAPAECVINKQLEFMRDNFHFYNYVDHKTMYRVLGEDTLILMLDTNIYDEDETDFSCYVGSENITREFLQEKQKENCHKIISEIRDIDKIKNIIFTAHHPIVSLKMKEKENKESGQKELKFKPEVLTSFVDFINETFLLPFYDKTFYHFCAHVHHYQQVELVINSIKIHQYVVGTGGAHEDPISLTFEGKYPNYEELRNQLQSSSALKKQLPLHYQLIEERSGNGFLHIRLVEYGDLQIQFIPVVVESPSAAAISPDINGGRRSRRRFDHKHSRRRRVGGGARKSVRRVGQRRRWRSSRKIRRG